MVYSSIIGDRKLTFGISGRLYKSNVLLYDHQTESLWSQLKSQAISGGLVGRRLETIPSSRMSWRRWKNKHPQTEVLSNETGYNRNYSIDPYEGYYRVGSIMFPVGKVRGDFSAKERILGVSIRGVAKAYAIKDLQKGPGVLKDRIGESLVMIEVSPEGEVLAVRDEGGNEVAHMFVYWFAWQAFHPRTTVYKP